MLEITCPSGLRGTLRGMKVKDEKLFSDKKLIRSGAVIGQLLTLCWEETLDPGPYIIEGKLNWDSALSADRTYAMIQLRIESYGDTYEFAVTCQGCSHHFGWSIKLSDLDTIPVSPKAIECIRTGVPISVTVDGHLIKCRPLTGSDERDLLAAAGNDPGSGLVLHLTRRVVEIDGETNPFKIRDAIEELPAATADRLWDVTDELEGGVETTFDVDCPSCGGVMSMAVPFGAGFFSSRKRFARQQRAPG